MSLDRALLEWPLVVAATVIFGSAAFVLLSAGDRDHLSALIASVVPVWRPLSLIILLVSPFELIDITAEMAAVSWKAALPFVPEVLTGTHAGRVWEWFLPAGLLLLLATYLPIRETIRAWAPFVLAGILLFLRALMSHAIDKGLGAVIVYFVHEAAAGLWVGALLTLWLAARHGNIPHPLIEEAARRVSTIAFWAVVAIVVSGIYTAYHGLGFSLHNLFFTAYGRTLIAKVTVFAAVLALGGHNRYWLVPKIGDSMARERLVRNVGMESLILLFVVLVLASVLANTPPAHGLGTAGHSMMAM